MTNVPFLLKKIDSLHWNVGDTLPLESSAAVLVPPLPMPCSLPRVWFCEWIRESTPCCTTCNISLCAFETQIPPHFTSCILIERLGSVLSWIANRWQSTSSDGVQVKSAEKDSDFKLENIILSENCTGTGPQTCHPDMKDLFSITRLSLMWGVLRETPIF